MVPGILFAQKKNPPTNPTPNNNTPVFTPGGVLTTFAQMDQRKIYHWDTGTLSTASGRQAGEGDIGPYVMIYGDSAVVVGRYPTDVMAKQKNDKPKSYW
jgi:hypothetical protein